MVTESMHDFFVAAASVAGALVGLLFVAISVAGDRLRAEDDGPVYRIRAAAALTAFTNALAVPLFALIPGALGTGSFAFAIVGLLFVGGAALSLRAVPRWRWTILRDIAFMVGLATLFVFQLLDGLQIRDHGVHTRQSELALLVVFCFLIGIARAWELIGGPTIGLRSEALTLGREVLVHATRHDTD